MTTSSSKVLWVVFLTIFIDMLGIGVLIPVFPLLILHRSEFCIVPASWSLATSLIMAGWLMASFPLMQFIFAPILGQFSDKYGRKKILALSIAGTAFSYILFAYAIYSKNLYLMFISRALDGATGGNISVAHAVIGDISIPKNRARNFGIVGMALGSGFILGPFVGGKLSDPNFVSWFSAYTPFIFTAILSTINIFIVLKLLPETNNLKNIRGLDLSRPFSNIVKAFTDNDLKNINPAIFLFNAGFTFFTTFWGVILASRFNFNQGSVGNFFAYFGIMVILAQGGLVRRLSGKVTDYIVLRISIIGTGLCLLAYYFIPQNQTAWIYCIPPVMAGFIALTKSFSVSLITRVTPPQIRGEVMGINSSSNALANAIPALLAGYFAIHNMVLPVLVGSVTVIIGGLMFIYCFRPKAYSFLNFETDRL